MSIHTQTPVRARIWSGPKELRESYWARSEVISHGPTDASITIKRIFGSISAEIRGKLNRLKELVGQADHARLPWLADVPDRRALLLTLKRVRHDIDMLSRIARGAGSDALHDRADRSWRRAIEISASSLTKVSELLAGQDVPRDRILAAAVREYRATVDEMRLTGVMYSLSDGALGRLFVFGFAPEQLRRNLNEFIELTEGTSSLRGENAAAR